MTASDTEPSHPADLLDQAPDALLVERAVDGDTVAFGMLLRRHAPLMRAYTARIVGSLAEADDLVQDAFVIAWQQLPTLRDRAHVRAWLMRIVTRRAFRHVKRRRDTVELPDRLPDPGTDPETVAIRDAQLTALSAALDRLPDDQRQCWLLREIGELSYQEIADELNLTAGQARGKLARARVGIAVHMEGWR